MSKRKKNGSFGFWLRTILEKYGTKDGAQKIYLQRPLALIE
jgi:hypothetical protein